MRLMAKCGLAFISGLLGSVLFIERSDHGSSQPLAPRIKLGRMEPTDFRLDLEANREQQIQSLATRLAESSVHGLPGLYHEIRKAEDEVLRQMLVERWIELNPDNALEFCNQLIGNDESFIDGCLRQWAKLDPTQAIQGASRLRNSWRPTFETDVRSRVSSWELRRTAEQVKDRWSPLTNLFQHLVHLDPAHAEKLVQLSERTRKLDAIAGIASGLAKTDPANAITWSRQLPDSQSRQLAQREIAKSLALSQPDLAAETASQLPKSYQSLSTFATVAQGLLQTDPDAAINWIEETIPPGSLQRDLFDQLSSSLPAPDPAGLAQALLRSEPATGEAFLAEALADWASHDQEALLAWQREHPDHPQSEMALGAALRELATSDFDAAATLGEGTSAMSYVIDGYSQTHPDRAAEALLQHWPALAEDSPELLSHVFARWGERDSHEALEALASEETWRASSQFSRAAQTVANIWIRNEGIDSVAAWAENLPSGDLKEATAISLSHAVSGSDPLRAINYAAHIADLSQQKSHVSNILHYLPQSTDLEALLTNSNIDPDVAATLLRQRNRQP